LFYQQADAFNRPAATKEEVVLEGKKLCSACAITNRLMKALIHSGTLDFVSKLQQEQPLYSPRTFNQRRAAAAYRSQRVLFQIQQWKRIPLKPEDWGWKLTAGKLLPIRTVLPPAHAFLLDVVRRNCRKDRSTQRCT